MIGSVHLEQELAAASGLPVPELIKNKAFWFWVTSQWIEIGENSFRLGQKVVLRDT